MIMRTSGWGVTHRSLHAAGLSIKDPQMLYNLCQPLTKLHDLCLNVPSLLRTHLLLSLSLPAIQQTADDYILHSKPRAGHPVGAKKLIRHSPCPQETDNLVRKHMIIIHHSLI